MGLREKNPFNRIYNHLLFIVLALALSGPVLAAENPRSVSSVDFRHGDLKVSGNRRFIAHKDGTPFFYLGDTAWELFHRLNRQEAERYLDNRLGKEVS